MTNGHLKLKFQSTKIKMIRKNRRKYYIVFFVISICSLVYLFLQNSDNLSSKSNKPDQIYMSLTKEWKIQNPNEKTSLILFWTDHFSDRTLWGWGVDHKILDNCDSKCDFTTNRDLIGESDALVFHTDWYMWWKNPMPSIRKSNQLWIMYWHESPHYTYLNLKNYQNFFNWTLTYRRDSEIYNPYGKFVKLQPWEIKTRDILPKKESFKNKKLVAWLVSSCHSISNREGFVRELQKFINVDIFGDCGAPCPDQNCMKYIGENYKFYLSLENSICQDYITEKFFNAYAHGLVPITNGLGVQEIAPKGSYIHLDDFSNNAQKLSEYLIWLNQVEGDEFINYFEWNMTYRLDGSFANEVCNLCTKVNEFKNKPSAAGVNVNSDEQEYEDQVNHKVDENDKIKANSYADLYDWWYFKKDKNGQIQPICVEKPNYYNRIKAYLDYLF